MNFSSEVDEKVVWCEVCDTSVAYSGMTINLTVCILKCLPLMGKKKVLSQKSSKLDPNSAKANGITPSIVRFFVMI
jgi:hypothetical protein